MKRHWETEELVEHWTLMPPEIELSANKTDATRLGFAVLLKFFQREMRFPQSAAEIPPVVVDYLAKQVKVRPDQFQTYEWRGRTIEYHRAQIRALHGIRSTSVEDANALSQWLQEHALQQERNYEHLKVAAYQRCRELKIEPPRPERVERLVRSAMRSHEEAFNAETGCWGVTEQKIHLSKGLDGLFHSCGSRRPRFAKYLAKVVDFATDFCEWKRPANLFVD